jgi:hypothetical protein
MTFIVMVNGKQYDIEAESAEDARAMATRIYHKEVGGCGRVESCEAAQ